MNGKEGVSLGHIMTVEAAAHAGSLLVDCTAISLCIQHGTDAVLEHKGRSKLKPLGDLGDDWVLQFLGGQRHGLPSTARTAAECVARRTWRSQFHGQKSMSTITDWGRVVLNLNDPFCTGLRNTSPSPVAAAS